MVGLQVFLMTTVDTCSSSSHPSAPVLCISSSQQLWRAPTTSFGQLIGPTGFILAQQPSQTQSYYDSHITIIIASDSFTFQANFTVTVEWRSSLPCTCPLKISSFAADLWHTPRSQFSFLFSRDIILAHTPCRKIHGLDIIIWRRKWFAILMILDLPISKAAVLCPIDSHFQCEIPCLEKKPMPWYPGLIRSFQVAGEWWLGR